MILVDTNVLLDLVKADPAWLGWSLAKLEEFAIVGPVAINPVVYAELSVGYSAIDDLDAFIDGTGLRMLEIPRRALFLAGQAFSTYRRSGGTRNSILPDFFIGAQAEAMNMPLLTRDVGRYRTYFPNVRLISPDNHP